MSDCHDRVPLKQRTAPAFHLSTRAAALLGEWVLLPAVLGLLLAALAGSVVQLWPQQIQTVTPEGDAPYLDDFVVFYAAGRLVVDGEQAGLYDLGGIHAAEIDVLDTQADRVTVLPFFNPPWFAVFMAPWSVVPLSASAAIWVAVGLGAFLTGMVLILRRRPEPLTLLGSAVFALALMASMPFYQVLVHGQATFLTMVGWMLIWRGISLPGTGRSSIWGLLILSVKPPMTLLPAAQLLFSGRWRSAVAAAIGVLLVALATGLFLGFEIYDDFLRLAAEAARWEEENGVSIVGMFGWNAVVRGLFGEGLEGPRRILSVSLAVVTVAIALVLAHRHRKHENEEELFATLVFATILISPHLYAHDLLVVTLPLGLLMTKKNGEDRRVWVVFAALGWILMYFHFDILAAIRVNSVGLWLMAGVALTVIDASRMTRWIPGRLGYGDNRP